MESSWPVTLSLQRRDSRTATTPESPAVATQAAARVNWWERSLHALACPGRGLAPKEVEVAPPPRGTSCQAHGPPGWHWHCEGLRAIVRTGPSRSSRLFAARRRRCRARGAPPASEVRSSLAWAPLSQARGLERAEGQPLRGQSEKGTHRKAPFLLEKRAGGGEFGGAPALRDEPPFAAIRTSAGLVEGRSRRAIGAPTLERLGWRGEESSEQCCARTAAETSPDRFRVTLNEVTLKN